MKTCTKCNCPTEYDTRLTCPMCGEPYGDPEITRQLQASQREMTTDELLAAMSGPEDDFAAAEELLRRLL